MRPQKRGAARRGSSGSGKRAAAARGRGPGGAARGGGEPDQPDAVAPTGCGGAAGGGGERNRSSLRQTRSMSAGMGWDVGGFEGGEGRRRAKLPSRHARERNAGRAQLRAGARAWDRGGEFLRSGVSAPIMRTHRPTCSFTLIT